MRRGRPISVHTLRGTIPNESSATSLAPTSSLLAPSRGYPSTWQGPSRPWSSTTAAALCAVSPDPRSGAQRRLDRLRDPPSAGLLPDTGAHGLDDRSHGTPPRNTLVLGAGDLLHDDDGERLVAELGREVGSEDLGLAPLACRQFVPPRCREDVRGLRPLADLGAEETEHLVVGQGRMGLSGDLRPGDGGEGHPQRRAHDVVLRANRFGQIGPELVLERRHRVPIMASLSA